ncbi:NFACT RNA binding domain-containing protein [Ruminococcus sp. FC2018]|uniref:Rqc2 family fibronectin-binding protein n=1 Tax=Ruminococcus sp. FC2018 TaxID=1410617 RepID=UPI000490602A|nr:NFACT RNA binding domain-containing protein [Ruminococcus sp. FC2018]
MALDGVFLSLIKNELSCLIGGRVDRIHQPSREELVIGIRTMQGVKKVLFSADPGSARIHLTSAEIENPKAPPMFCMLMRKHLSSGKLTDIRQDGFERILCFDFEATNEMGDKVRLTLVSEIMGRYSNIMLVNGQGKIIDSIKRVGSDHSSVRVVLPGVTYEPPPRDDRLDLCTCTFEQLKDKLGESPKSETSKALLKAFEGISPILAREMCFFALRGEEKTAWELTTDELDRLWFFIGRLRSDLEKGENTFTVVKTKEGVLKDFCFCPIHQYGALMVTREFESPGELLDFFYSQRDAYSRTKQKASDLFKLIVNLTERTKRRVENQRLELEQCGERDKLRVYADLIMANPGSIKKGQTSCTLMNFYEQSCPEITIPLDRRLSPIDNAQKYYKQYHKLGAAQERLTALIASGEEESKYLDSVFDALTRATTEAEIAELRLELSEQGYIRNRNSKGKPPKALPPMEFEIQGFTVRVGRNNKQNDKLTCKTAEKTDIWLHTKDIPGSHTVISAKGGAVPDGVILTAARLAAYFSKAKDSSQVGVDYALIRHVKKPAGARPGMVIFTNNKTVYVSPLSDEQLQELSKGSS